MGNASTSPNGRVASPLSGDVNDLTIPLLAVEDMAIALEGALDEALDILGAAAEAAIHIVGNKA
jgi:hypothetical protein